MARPRNIHFFEEIHPTGPGWLETYHENSRILVEYLKDHGARRYATDSAIKCLSGLREYLIDANIVYSSEIAIEWLQANDPNPQGYRATVDRLCDLYTYGEIQPLNSFPMALPYRKLLDEPWSTLTTEYLDSLTVSLRYIEEKKNCITRFLYGIQTRGVMSPAEITFDLLEDYCEKDAKKHCSSAMKAKYTYEIGDFLLFLADNGLCTHGLSWYPYYRMHGKILRMTDLTDGQIATIEECRPESQEFPAEEYAAIIPDFLDRFSKLGYHNTPCKAARYTLYNLLLFLEMHGLGYHRGIARVWLAHEQERCNGQAWKQNRRILNLFDLYLQEGDVIPGILFRVKPLLCESLPTWCRDELDEYLQVKIKEGWEHSTISMIRSAVTRFCSFIVTSGMESFAEITPMTLKTFNICDEHLTFEAKNAYNGRIRKFVKHLERKGVVPYGLHTALPVNALSKEEIVITFTDDEKYAIRSRYETDLSGMELRDNAILQLGMKTGLRSCDIVALKLEDIDWEKQTIRIVQKKTRHEIIVPMPTDVGNAVYLYLTKGRPNEKTCSREIFVKHRVPFDALSGEACNRALKHALPDRAVPRSGFHVTRKTFATDKLRSGTGKQKLTDLLGQKDTSSLRHYLHFDEDKMRMCPISLEEASLQMKGGRYERV